MAMMKTWTLADVGVGVALGAHVPAASVVVVVPAASVVVVVVVER
jgi:hypothetical protein